ncbi:Uncharacterised protein [Mycobacterium tuberculosis]|nr:Uncharacterised protein [Mycobacterium tuberculosis]
MNAAGSPSCALVTGAPSARQADRLVVLIATPVSLPLIGGSPTGNAAPYAAVVFGIRSCGE